MSDAATPARPRIRLTPEEAWDFIEQAHTGIFGTLRSDGMPIMLPIWFVVIDRKIYVRTGRRFQEGEASPAGRPSLVPGGAR